MDRYAAARERQRDPPGADTELERPTIPSQLGQQVDHRIHHGWIELMGVPLVVPGRDWRVEVAVVVHPTKAYASVNSPSTPAATCCAHPPGPGVAAHGI
jgi:hypothetical protein